MHSTGKIRLLIVDDSAVMRSVLRRIIDPDPSIEVVGTASDPYEAKDKILQLNPDVLTLDIEMPKMDGLTFLKILMKQRPLPVIVMSTLSQSGSTVALEALQRGAVEVMGKPGGPKELGTFGPQLLEKIKGAVIARNHRPKGTLPPQPMRPKVPQVNCRFSARKLLLIGASTGGTEAIKEVLLDLPGNLPGIAIVQHIPPHFSKAFADRLNTLCAMEVREAKHGDALRPGMALVAPGNYHMTVQWAGSHYRVNLNQAEPVWHQRPAVDILFESAVKAVGREAVATVLTGMGRDGAAGLLALRQAGAQTYSQDEKSSVVYGMPRAAMENGGSQRAVPLSAMARTLLSALDGKHTVSPMKTVSPL